MWWILSLKFVEISNKDGLMYVSRFRWLFLEAVIGWSTKCVSRWLKGIKLPRHVRVPVTLTLKQRGKFIFKMLFANVVHYKCNILVWNWSNTMNILSALWILMAWCFSTRASVATVLSVNPCISSCLGVNPCWNILQKHKNMIVFSIISQHWNAKDD